MLAQPGAGRYPLTRCQRSDIPCHQPRAGNLPGCPHSLLLTGQLCFSQDQLPRHRFRGCQQCECKARGTLQICKVQSSALQAGKEEWVHCSTDQEVTSKETRTRSWGDHISILYCASLPFPSLQCTALHWNVMHYKPFCQWWDICTALKTSARQVGDSSSSKVMSPWVSAELLEPNHWDTELDDEVYGKNNQT